MESDTYTVTLPDVFTGVHNDAHATAIWFTLKPFVNRYLRLPFGVSPPFAEAMYREYGVEFTNVDSCLRPRGTPRLPRPCLLFSGGMDSAAATLILPKETVHLFLDRLVVPGLSEASTDVLLDLVEQRAACRAAQKMGRDVHMVRDSHESLWKPYPSWHSEMSVLPVLYLADSLDVSVFETGDVMGVAALQGYRRSGTQRWNFNPSAFRSGDEDESEQTEPPGASSDCETKKREIEFRDMARNPSPHLDSGPVLRDILRLEKRTSSLGLSEVATSLIVNRSPLRGKSWSCYHPADGDFCMRCDKCFKKMLLRHIVDGKPAPADLIDHFLSFPHLAEIFAHEFFDWHHIWFYIFQRLESPHPFVQELRRQARQGPDLSLLEKWYPGALYEIPAAYRDEVQQRIDGLVGTMNAEEVSRLERLDLPPLHAPVIKR